MSIAFSIAIRAVPFFDLLEEEEQALSTQVRDIGEGPAVAAAMDTSRRRLAQGVEAFVRSLPTVVRSDVNTARVAAYALVGLVDERMLHHPAGGLDRWRERLLEFELYGSALAGQEIVSRARASAYGTTADTVAGADAQSSSLLAPLYLSVFRAGFEGSLRGDSAGLASLLAALEETVGTGRTRPDEFGSGARPARMGLAAGPMAAIGLGLWLASGLAVWTSLSHDTLERASRVTDRVAAGLPVGNDPAASLGYGNSVATADASH